MSHAKNAHASPAAPAAGGRGGHVGLDRAAMDEYNAWLRGRVDAAASAAVEAIGGRPQNNNYAAALTAQDSFAGRRCRPVE